MSNQIDFQQFTTAGRKTVFYYTELKANSLLVFSIFNFFYWTLSTALEAFNIAMAEGSDDYKHSNSLVFLKLNADNSATIGFFTTVIYMITAFLGYSTSYTPTKKLLISTIVFSLLCIPVALLIGTMAVLTKSMSCIKIADNPVQSCHEWLSIERALAIVSCLVVINNLIVLVLASLALRGGPQPMLANGYSVIETRHNDNSDEAPFIMVQSQIPMMQFPFHVVRQSQQTEELYPVGQPKHP